MRQLHARDESDGASAIVVGDQEVVPRIGEEALGGSGLGRVVEEEARGAHRLRILGSQRADLDRHGRHTAGAGSRSALTSAGAPRSGNGTSIASKSRGTTVAGKLARASSRTSRGK